VSILRAEHNYLSILILKKLNRLFRYVSCRGRACSLSEMNSRVTIFIDGRGVTSNPFKSGENMKCQGGAMMEEMQNFKKCYHTLPLRNEQFI